MPCRFSGYPIPSSATLRCSTKDLKKWLWGADKGDTLKSADLKALEQAFDTAAAAR